MIDAEMNIYTLVTSGGKLTNGGKVVSGRSGRSEYSFPTLLVVLMPPKVPAPPREEIEPRLYTASLPGQDICIVLRSANLCALDPQSEQLAFFCGFAKKECYTALPAAIVAKVLNIQDSHVWKTQSNAQKKSRQAPRPPTLSPE
jgi:hypothetical protein